MAQSTSPTEASATPIRFLSLSIHRRRLAPIPIPSPAPLPDPHQSLSPAQTLSRMFTLKNLVTGDALDLRDENDPGYVQKLAKVLSQASPNLETY